MTLKAYVPSLLKSGERMGRDVKIEAKEKGFDSSLKLRNPLISFGAGGRNRTDMLARSGGF
jgi:hypothetical protein